MEVFIRFKEVKPMLTNFGKFLRKLRIDRCELLKDMSEKLNVTVSYLSAVENGKRAIPENWLEIIKDDYNLDEEMYIEMQDAAYEDEGTISLKYGSEDKNLALAFAREFNELSNDEKISIMDVLNKRNLRS